MLGAIPETAEHALPLVPRRHNVAPAAAPSSTSAAPDGGREVDEVRRRRVVAVPVAATAQRDHQIMTSTLLGTAKG